jgi:hypothetical protein
MSCTGSRAVAGWYGHIELLGNGGDFAGGKLRFNTESINIPQGVELITDLHTGHRVPGAYRYTLVVPEGAISFPLLAVSTNQAMTAVQPVPPYQSGPPDIDVTMRKLMKKGLMPYQDMNQNDYFVDQVPCIGDIVIHRGDMDKRIFDAWVGSMSVTGDANSNVSVTTNIMGIFGSIASPTRPDPITEIVRAVHFNELDWVSSWGNPAYLSNLKLTALGGQSTADGKVRPRNFNININQNLQRDDSYNPENPQAIIGFTFAQQEVTAELTFTGAYVPASPGSDQLIENIVLGGLFNITGGIWTAKTLMVPGPAELAATTLTLSAISSGLFTVEPGEMLVPNE